MLGKWTVVLMLGLSVLFIYTSDVYAALPSGTDTEDIDKAVETFMATHDDIEAGLMFSIFTPNDVLHETYTGYQNIEAEIPVSDTSVFEWGSVSKLLTWVSVMQLAEEGLLDLEADITVYLPETMTEALNYTEPVTMINLMNHQGGFQEQISGLFVSDRPENVSLQNVLTDNQPLQIYAPGTVTAYSNWGAALAGYIVEAVSGQPFYEYVHENIFTPLNMTDTALGPDLRDHPEIHDRSLESTGYIPADPPDADEKRYLPMYPAGAAVSTLPDLVTFAQALFPSNENTPLFNDDETLAKMFEATDFYGDSDAPRSAHGMLVTMFKHPLYGHGGNTIAFSANLLLDIETDVGYIVMANQAQEFTYSFQFPEVIFGSYKDSDFYPDTAPFDAPLYESARAFLNGPYSIFDIALITPKEGIQEFFPFMVSWHNNGREYYASPQADYAPMSTAQILKTLGEILLIAVPLLYAAAVLFIGGAVNLIKHIRYRKKPNLPRKYLMTRWHYTGSSLIIIFYINLAALGVNVLSFASKELLTVFISGFLFLFILGLSYIILLIIRYPSFLKSKISAASYVILLAVITVMLFNIIYFDMYQFWNA